MAKEDAEEQIESSERVENSEIESILEKLAKDPQIFTTI